VHKGRPWSNFCPWSIWFTQGFSIPTLSLRIYLSYEKVSSGLDVIWMFKTVRQVKVCNLGRILMHTVRVSLTCSQCVPSNRDVLVSLCQSTESKLSKDPYCSTFGDQWLMKFGLEVWWYKLFKSVDTYNFELIFPHYMGATLCASQIQVAIALICLIDCRYFLL